MALTFIKSVSAETLFSLYRIQYTNIHHEECQQCFKDSVLLKGQRRMVKSRFLIFRTYKKQFFRIFFLL